MTLRLFEDQIEVYAGGELAATLARCWGKGQRIIQDEHYVGRHRGSGRKRVTLQQRFEALGPAAREYLQGLAQKGSGRLRDQVESILALCDTHGADAVYAAMERANQYHNYSYKAIKRILEQQERNPQALPHPPAEPLPVTVPVPTVTVQQRSLSYYERVGRP